MRDRRRHHERAWLDKNSTVKKIAPKKSLETLFSVEKNVENNITLIEVENSIENQLGQKPQDLWKKDKENTFNLNTELDIDLSNCALLGDLSSITFGLQTKDKKTYVSNVNKRIK